MWQMLAEDKRLVRKGPILCLSRWYSWVDAHEHWQELYNCRLLLMLIWAMGCGLLTKKAETVSLALVKPSSSAAADVALCATPRQV